MAKLVTQAVILCGGQGTRMRPFTYTAPKPMFPIVGKPFLEYLLLNLKQNNITDVILLVGYLHEKIERYFGDGSKWGLKITYSYLPPEADTGARLKNAFTHLDHHFLLLYSDNYWPLRLSELIKLYQEKNLPALVTVYSNVDHYSQNNILVEDGLVKVYDRKRQTSGLNGVDIGFFILKKEILNLLPEGNSSFEDIALLELVKRKQLAGFYTHHRYYGLSNLERVKNIEDYFIPKKVVFLDRDGVINQKPAPADYVKKWEEFTFLPQAKKALKKLYNAGFWLFIVTNQPGVARGMMSRQDLENIHRRMVNDMAADGIEIKGIYSCLHGWDEGCFCRKPKPGLLYQAAAENAVELYDSFLIGDDERDIAAGQSAGCRTIFICDKTGMRKSEINPDIMVRSFSEAVEKIL